MLRWPRRVAAEMAAVVGADCRSLAAVGIVIIAAAVVAVHSPPHRHRGGDDANCRCCRCKGDSKKGHPLPPLQERGKEGGDGEENDKGK